MKTGSHTFLITRPLHQTQSLCKSLTSLGHRTIVWPTLEIVPSTLDFIQVALSTLEEITLDKVIFTSANAVIPMLPFKAYWFCDQIFAAGPGTAKMLARWNILAQTPTPLLGSQGLLALPAFQAVNKQHILVLGGLGGQEDWMDHLRHQGAWVKKIVAYRAEKPKNIAPLPIHIPKVWVISTSLQSLRYLWEMASVSERVWLLQQPLVVISAAMKAHALTLGFKAEIRTAANASDEAVLCAAGIM